MDSLPKNLAAKLQIALALVAMTVAMISFFTGSQSLADLLSGTKTSERVTISKAELESLKAEIESIKQNQAKLNNQVNSLSQPKSDSALTLNVNRLNDSVTDVEGRLEKIEGLIIQDPQKALEIPLLRKDLDNLSVTTNVQIDAIRQDVERSYNLVLVTIVALAIAVLAPAVGNIFKKDNKIDNDKKDDPKPEKRKTKAG